MFSRAVLIARELFFSPEKYSDDTLARNYTFSIFSAIDLVDCFKDVIIIVKSYSLYKVYDCHLLRRLIALGIHLFPSRTEKLSPTAPMVLHLVVGE